MLARSALLALSPLLWSASANAQCDVQLLNWSSTYADYTVPAYDGTGLVARKQGTNLYSFWSHSGGSWVPQGPDLTAGSAHSPFAYQGDWLIIGRPTQAWGGHYDVYERSPMGWTLNLAFDGFQSGHMPGETGDAITFTGQRFVVGDPAVSYNHGLIYTREWDGSSWVDLGWLHFGTAQESRFGDALGTINDDQILVGAPGTGLTVGGSVFVLNATPTGWAPPAAQQTTGIPGAKRFGKQIIVGDGLIVIASDLGSTTVYEAFTMVGSGLTPLAPFPSPQGWPDPATWGAVDAWGNQIVIGLPQANGGAGEIARFARLGSGWQELSRLGLDQSGPFGMGTALALTREGVVGAAPEGSSTQGGLAAWPSAPWVQAFCQCRASAPCGNYSQTGGCVNGTGQGASLTGCGSSSLSQDLLTLRIEDLPANVYATLFMGTATTPTTLGGGQLCLAGSLQRFPTLQAQGSTVEYQGLGALSQSLPASAHLVAGLTQSFQVWYRDPQNPCGATSNFTNALTVTFQP